MSSMEPKIINELTIVDNSTLTAVAACPTQATIRYVLGLTMPDDRAPLRAGHLAHEILASHLRGASIEDSLIVAEVANYLEFSTGSIEPNDRLYHDNVLRIMRRWLESHPVSGLPFTIPNKDLVEVGFGVPLTDDIMFVGRMDALAKDASGAWYVIEHKSTGRLDATWRRRFKTSAQITGYVWAAQQYLNEPVAGCFVNGIEFGHLPNDGTRKCRTHGVMYAECGALHARFDMLIEHRAPHQLEAWKADAIKLARRFQSLKNQVTDLDQIGDVPMTGQFTGACGLCQFADFCSVGRPVSVGKTMLSYEPWSPFAHAFSEPAPA